MISTLKQVAMAEKLSIPQLQQAVKNGTIESWIGIPMIQERMKDQKQSQAAAAAQQPQQPKVAEQVLMEAAQQGLEGLPTNLPQQYATGGIIGYADGGELDDEEREDEREEEEFAEYAQAMLNRTPRVDMSYSQVQGQPLRAARQPASEGKYDARGHKYDALADKFSSELGLPSNLARYALHRETGGLKNPETAVSKAGAIGPGQLMPATAKMLGVDPRKPEENVYGMVKYLKQMYDKYDGNEQLALAAYNAGPGRVDQALKSGKGIAGLPTETRGYIKFAEGGVARYAEGGSPFSRWLEETYPTPQQLSPEEYVARENKRAELGSKSGILGFFKTQTPEEYKHANIEREAANKALEPTEPKKNEAIGLPAAIQAGTNPRALDNQSIEKLNQFKKEESEKQPTTTTTTTQQQTTEPKKSDAYEDLIGMIRDRMAKRESDKDQDKWMGLLSAGLGMLGGTSPYAGVNVGQGAMYGLQQYGQARKQAGAEEAADIKSLLTAGRYKDLSDYYKSKGEESTALRTRQLDIEEATKIQNALLNYEKLYETKANNAAKGEVIPANQEKIRQQYMEKMYQDPSWQRLWKQANPGLDLPTFGATSVTVPPGVKVTPIGK